MWELNVEPETLLRLFDKTFLFLAAQLRRLESFDQREQGSARFSLWAGFTLGRQFMGLFFKLAQPQGLLGQVKDRRQQGRNGLG